MSGVGEPGNRGREQGADFRLVLTLAVEPLRASRPVLLTLGVYDGAGHQREIDDDNFVDETGAAWNKVGDGPYLNVGGPFYGQRPSLADLNAYSWPDPDNPGYYRGLRDRARTLRQNSDCAIVLNLPAGVIHLGHAWTHDLVHDEAAGDIFQLFGHVLAQLLQPTTTSGASIARREHGLIAWQVIRQRSPLWPALLVSWRGRVL